jgi:hypothetical protein
MSSSISALPFHPYDRTGVLNVVTWLLLVTNILAFLARIVTKQVVTLRFNWDDLVISLAVVCIAAALVFYAEAMG